LKSQKTSLLEIQRFVGLPGRQFKVRAPGVERLWKELAARGTASPKLWMDAYLAAFALAGRYSMVTTDAGFRQFRGLDLLVLG